MLLLPFPIAYRYKYVETRISYNFHMHTPIIYRSYHANVIPQPVRVQHMTHTRFVYRGNENENENKMLSTKKSRFIHLYFRFLSVGFGYC